MILYEQGREYWMVAKRYHANRSNPAIKPVAVRDMQRIMGQTSSAAVRARAFDFTRRHGAQTA